MNKILSLLVRVGVAGRILLFFLSFFLCFTASAQNEGSYTITGFTKKEYNAESQNWSVTHDESGIIYLANNAGLLEYDGVDWSFYPMPTGTIIRAVATDAEGRIFTSGYREIGYWTRKGDGKLEYHSLNELVEDFYTRNEEFWSVTVAGGKVYFRSFNSIFVYDYQRFNVVRPGPLISSIGKLNDRLFVFLSGQGLYTLEDSVLVSVYSDPAVNSIRVEFMEQLDGGTLLIGTSVNGLFIYDGVSIKPFLAQYHDYFVQNNVNRGYVTQDGYIILGTVLDGVIIFSGSGDILYSMNKGNGMLNNTVLGLDVDQEENIWVALDQGVDYISFDIDPSYEIHEFEHVGAVYSLAVHDGYIYLCTNQGVFFRPEGIADADFELIEGTQGQAWNCGVFDGELLVGHNLGTFQIMGENAVRISDIGGGMSFVRNPADPGLLIHSTYTSLAVLENENGTWGLNRRINGFSELIRYIEFDQINRLWAAHMRRGIYSLSINEELDSVLTTRYYGKETFGKDNNIQVFKVENRIVFTTGDLMYTYDDLSDSIIPFENLNTGLGEYATAHRIISGPDHHYWLISKTGIALFRIYENQFRLIKEYPYAIFSDHLILGYENIIPVDNYRAMLCMDNGYALLNADMDDLSGDILDRKLLLKQLKFRGVQGQYEFLTVDRDRIKLPHKKNSLYLKYAFPFYSRKDIVFQSYINGLENEWSVVNDKPEFIFERIPPGEYTIYTRAINRWGKSSQVETIELSVMPAWYLSRISFIAYMVIVIAGILLFRSVLIARIRARERNIRNSKERELIRLRNDNLNAELAYRSQELANSTMAIIRKNEFLLKLKSIIQNQKEELGSRYPDKYYREIINRIDKNVSSMDDWKVFEFHFEKAHDKFLQKLITTYPELTHGDLRLCAYLRMNLSTKEIAPLMRISIRGVENHRYKLRKKLDLKPEENLTEFILSL